MGLSCNEGVLLPKDLGGDDAFRCLAGVILTGVDTDRGV